MQSNVLVRLAAAALCCVALAAGARARAEPKTNEIAALLPMRVDRGVNKQLATHALRAMQDFLFDRGYALVDARKLNKLPAALRNCSGQTCLARVHRALGADHVIATELHRAATGTELGVQWSDAAFVAYATSVALSASTPDAAEDAGADAIRAVLEKQRRGPGPWLSIAGTPVNAVVEINGKAAGSVPFLGRVEPGAARVVVRKDGYDQHAEKVVVGDKPDSYQRLRVKLEPKQLITGTDLRPLRHGSVPAPPPIVAAPAPDARMRDDTGEFDDDRPSFHPLDVAIGSALFLGGAALAVGPAQTWARDGKCWDPPQCTQRVEFGRAQQVQLASGAALAVVGVLWTFVFKPIGRAGATSHYAARAPGSN